MRRVHHMFLPYAKSIWNHVQCLSERSGYDCYIASVWRDPYKQWELYKKGRTQNDKGRWIIQDRSKVVTYARPDQTPHCVTDDGAPASCAIDIAITKDGAWLPDKHPGWGIIGAAVALAACGDEVVWGAHFNRLRDWPHIEYRTWRELRG